MTEQIKTDYCVVGAGIAGLLTASSLARTGKHVVIVDQGPAITEPMRAKLRADALHQFHYGADYNDGLGEDVRTPTAGASAMRLFGTGGTALHFGGWMVRPIEDDHEVRTRFGYGRDWPLSYAELEPWLAKAEAETGVPGIGDNRYAAPRSRPFPMAEHGFSHFDRQIFGPALEALGMQGHSCPFAVVSARYVQEYGERSPCAGFRVCKFCPTGARYSPDRVHGAWLQQQPGVEIMNGLSLRRLEASKDGRRISAAHARKVDGHEEVVITAKHYVLTMGGVATPRMLLLSDSAAHPQGIGNASGQIGVGYGGHINSIAIVELDQHAGGTLGFPTMQCDHGRRNGDRRERPSWTLIGGTLGNDWPSGAPAVQWAMDGDRLSLSRLRAAAPRLAYLLMMHEMSGTGRLTLDPQRTDVFEDRLAHIDMPFTSWDRQAEPCFQNFVEDLGVKMRVANSTCLPSECYYGHPSGSTAMAATADDGVCDANLKVFGTDNLHLCSNSVFPHMGANPPTLTIAALALRLGSHLAKLQ